jgi:hypothetical protein
MRALVHVSNDATEWFESLESQRLRISVAAVKGKVILFSTTDSKRDLLQSLSSMKEPGKQILTTLIMETPRGAIEKVEVDCCVGASENEISTFESVMGKVQEVCGQRDKGAKKGDDSAELFRRAILPLALAASKVEIFDKYGAALLLNKQAAALKALLEVENLEVILHTGPIANDVESIQEYNLRLNEIEELWVGMLNRTRASQSNKSVSRLTIYPIEGSELHHRWMIFHFLEDSKLLMSLHKGLQEFAFPKIREFTNFNLREDASEITALRADWINFRKDVKRYSVSWAGKSRI